MNKFKFFIWILFVVILGGAGFMFYKKNTETQQKPQIKIFSDEIANPARGFTDGLPQTPDSVITYESEDLDVGPAQKSTYYIDINQDGIPERIIKTFIETNNAHAYYEYKIEIKSNDKYVNIAPKNLKTINGASCDLQQIQFHFNPFKITMISRDLGESWDMPTHAKKQIFTLHDDEIKKSYETQMRSICDVKELF